MKVVHCLSVGNWVGLRTVGLGEGIDGVGISVGDFVGCERLGSKEGFEEGSDAVGFADGV